MELELPGAGVVALVGPAGSGKTAACLAEYGRLFARRGGSADGAARSAPGNSPLGPGRRGIWIAPSRAAAAELRERLVDLTGPLLDPGITTFAAIAAEVLRDAGALVAPITAFQRRRLLGRLIGELAADGALPHLAGLADSPGVLALVDEGIADHQRAGRAPAEAIRVAERTDVPQLLEVARVYGAYDQRLAAGSLVDAQTLLVAAAGALERAPADAPVDLVVVDGFADFTTIELRLLRQLAARTRSHAGRSSGRRDVPRRR